MNKRQTGILCPLWTLSHRGDHGIGDITSLRKLIPWVAECGIDFIQLLPINETDDSNSPYSAISSVALDPVYLDLHRLSGVSSCEFDGIKTSQVDYSEVRTFKEACFREAYAHFRENADEREPFQAFQKAEESWLSTYSIFRFLMALEDGSPVWQKWDALYNTPDKALSWIAEHLSAGEAGVLEEIEYFEWLQWQCHLQWAELRDYATRYHVKLMGDIPVGVSFNSADVFFEPENFNLEWFGGAPPETFFKDDAFAIKWGQNWGIPLYDDAYLRQSDFQWWRRRIQKHTEIFSMFRIDHILGLYRIYSFPWSPTQNEEFLPLSEEEVKARTGGRLPGFHPHGDEPREHAQANLKRGDEIIKVLLDAAGDAEIIAEDLGVTPDYVRPHLKEVQIAGFRICHWEANINGSPRPVTDYPYYSLATFTTHDHPPLASIWNGYREGLSSPDSDIVTDAEHHLRALSQMVGIRELESLDELPAFNDMIKWELLEHLLQISSKYATFMITDALGTTDRFNIPATIGEHNWSHRIEYSVEDFYQHPYLTRIRDLLSENIRRYRRCHYDGES